MQAHNFFRFLIHGLGLIFLCLYSLCTFCTDIDVRIFTSVNLRSVVITPLSGKYVVYSDNKKILDLYKNNPVTLSVKKGKISLSRQGELIGLYSSLYFSSEGFLNTFTFKPVEPAIPARVYDDGIKIAPDDSLLRVINKVELEHYVAGIVESEGGIKQNLEFLKLQAIISRTYAVSNSHKHLKPDGYNFCDNVHCQVYKGRCINSMIMMATSQTSGFVIIDKTGRPISAAYHSNCGGQTANSENVWSVVTTYLKSVADTFCLRQSQAHWQVTIALSDWLGYLSRKFSYPVSDSIMRAKAISFSQPSRLVNFSDKPLIPLKTIRLDWMLKSAFFSISHIGDSLLFSGRGFGHGVGLCQEGAMHMVDLGWTYKDIIRYYYKDVSIVNISDLKMQ